MFNKRFTAKAVPLTVVLTSAILISSASFARSNVYADFPITLKDYSGSATTSVSYKGQMARHALESSLKKLISKGDVSAMQSYYSGGSADRAIIAPATKGDFVIMQSTIGELSSKNLSGKTYKGLIPGWPGNMTGPEVVAFMFEKAADAEGGYDAAHAYDYTQLVSKFLMGAVMYNQAVDNYLDEKLEADTKPNNKPYKDGAAYTGKEHVWDEAFGYFGAPSHTLTLSAQDVYNIAKQKDVTAADYNYDGKVDLYKEMAFGHAYYASSFDKGGKTTYLHDIVGAYMDGRDMLVAANASALSGSQRDQLKAYAQVIKTNWEKVIAEAVFKYAGETYEDMVKIEAILESNGDVSKAWRNYSKHWGELKGFALALQVGGKDMGATSVRLNRLIGHSPLLLGNTQVTGVDSNGEYIQSNSESWGGYMAHMLKVQNLMVDEFAVVAKSHDQTAGLAALVDSLGAKSSAEND